MCFKRCIGTKGDDSDKGKLFLTQYEENCIEDCAVTYMKQLKVMTKNFEKRLCILDWIYGFY